MFKIRLAISVLSVFCLAMVSATESLPSLTDAEMARVVSDNCGATTNMAWSACGFDATTCDGQVEKITVNAPTVKIPGTGISLPFDGTIWEWETGCAAGAVGKSACDKRQHEEAVSAPGNRVNDSFPSCGGWYSEQSCKAKKLTIFTTPGLSIPYPCIEDGHPAICTIQITPPTEITIDHGCENDPNAPGVAKTCPNLYNLMKQCTNE